VIVALKAVAHSQSSVNWLCAMQFLLCAMQHIREYIREFEPEFENILWYYSGA
jgi:hypothetical protein